MQSRGWRTSAHPAQQPPLTDDDTFYGEDSGYDEIYAPRMPSSSRRYQSRPDIRADIRSEMGRTRPDIELQSLFAEGDYYTFQTDRQPNIPPRRGATRTDMPSVSNGRRPRTHTEDVGGYGSDGSRGGIRRYRPHWLVFVGLFMLIMILGWIAFSALANWWQVTQDDWHYGRPRTFQIDAVVGHNDSVTNPSHFIAINLNRRVEVIEFPGGDSSKAKIYLGPILTGDGQDLAPVTLSFKDVNGDGKPDMIVIVQNSRFIYINENGAFRPARPNENIQD